MTRIIILTAPRSGTHFVVRSIAKSGGIPFKVTPYLRDGLPKTDSWIIGTHEPFPNFEEIEKAKAKVAIIERNPLDHVLSYFDHPANADSLEFVERVKTSRFTVNRNMHRCVEAIRFSYDDLVLKSVKEWKRLSDFIGFDVRPESLETTREAEGEYVARFGKPGRWRKCLSPAIAAEILRIIQPVYLHNVYSEIGGRTN